MRKLAIAFAAAAVIVAPAFVMATPTAARPMTAQADTISDVSSHGGSSNPSSKKGTAPPQSRARKALWFISCWPQLEHRSPPVAEAASARLRHPTWLSP